MYKRLTQLLYLLIISALLAACAAYDEEDQKKGPSTIPAFADSQNAPEQKVNAMRATAVKQAALSLGAQAGLAARSKQLNLTLNQDASNLDRIFNFRALMLDDNVLPPVLTQGDDPINEPDPNSLRLADKVYAIVSPPRFVTAPPNWREYLLMNYDAPDKPNSSLWPKGDAERDIWNDALTKGWDAGVKQANEIFSVNLNRLKRDYQGMVLYRILLAQNMVTPPFVAKANLGVTGDANKIRINDQVLRIAATSELVPNAQKWKPVITRDLNTQSYEANRYQPSLTK